MTPANLGQEYLQVAGPPWFPRPCWKMGSLFGVDHFKCGKPKQQGELDAIERLGNSDKPGTCMAETCRPSPRALSAPLAHVAPPPTPHAPSFVGKVEAGLPTFSTEHLPASRETCSIPRPSGKLSFGSRFRDLACFYIKKQRV